MSAFDRESARKRAEMARNHAMTYESMAEECRRAFDAASAAGDEAWAVAAAGHLDVAQRHILHFRATAEAYARIAKGERS